MLVEVCLCLGEVLKGLVAFLLLLLAGLLALVSVLVVVAWPLVDSFSTFSLIRRDETASLNLQ